MTGYHTRWARPEETADDPERIVIREAWHSARPYTTSALNSACLSPNSPHGQE